MGKKTSTSEPSQRPYFAWQERVAAHPDLNPIYKVVLWRLVLYRNAKSGRCDPSIPTLAKGAGVSKHTVQRAITKAEQLELIAVGRGGKNGSLYDHNRYRFIFSGVSTEAPPANDLGVPGQHAGGASAEAHKQQSNEGTASLSPEREIAAAAAGSGVPASLDGRPPRRKKGRTGDGAAGGGGGTAIPRSQELALLRGKWDRGHPRDATAPECRAVEQAWAAALTSGATPEVILAAADKWIAAVNKPWFLTRLPEWLETRSWEKPPPQRKQTNGSGRSSRRRGGRQGNGLSPGDEIMAEVAEEIRQRRMAQ